MPGKTKIEWATDSWNPVTGCTKVSQGCKNCYAKRDWARLSAMPNNAYTGREFEDVRWHPERLDQPLRWRAPRRVFVNSMSDLFHEDVPDEFIDQVFAIMAITSGRCRSGPHTFQILTKRPQRMLEYLNLRDLTDRIISAAHRVDSYGGAVLNADHHIAGDRILPLPNVWLGVSVEDQATADERIPLLLQTPAAVRWISAEPLLGSVDLTAVHYGDRFYVNTLSAQNTEGVIVQPGIDWVVVGGESGPNARPMHPVWAHAIRKQCAAAKVPFFFKQWGEWKPLGDYYDDEHPDRDEWCDIACESQRARLLTHAGHDWVVGVPGEGRHDGQPPSGTWVIERVGKRAAGRMLDGREWNQYPEEK